MSVDSRLARYVATSLFMLCVAVSSFGQSPAPSLFVSPPTNAAAAADKISSAFDPVERLRSRAVGFDAGALKSLTASVRDKSDFRSAAAPSAELNLFEDTSVPFFAESLRPTDDRVGQILSGPVGYARDGHAILTVYQGAMAGSVRLSNGEFYQIFVPANGYGEVEQNRFRGYQHGESDVLVPDRTGDTATETHPLPRAGDLAPYANAAGGQSIIDVIIAYTARAREARGGAPGMLAYLNQVIAETNQGFSNSDVAITFRLVHAVEVSFDDSSSSVGYDVALNALRGSSDGAMDEVHALRDQYGADLVSLFISPPLPSSGTFTVGMAFILASSPATFDKYAFSVVHQSYAGGSSLSFPHEAGHNLGLNHDLANGGGAGGLHKSSVGYQQKALSPTFFTIMAYSSGCGGCAWLNNFSNPRVSYSGIPTGIAGNLDTAGTVDAAATLEEVRVAASGWRTAATPSCTYSLSSNSNAQSSSGGSATVGVTAGNGCSWTAQSNASWITVSSGASGAGNGTVSLSVAQNTSTSSRTGTVTIAGQTFTVQQAAAPCTYSLSSTLGSIGNSGGPLGTNVLASANCSWTAQSNAAWITVSSGASGTGNGTVSLSVAQNTSTSSRTGTVTIAGQTFTVQQAAAPCTYSLSSTLGSVANSGGPLGTSVLTSANCSWTAQSNAAWITVSSGASGAGNGTVSLSVAQNTSTSSRTGTVTIAGQTFTVQQAAAPCAYSLSSTLGSIGNGGGPLGTNVLTSANCSWTAQSNAAWITVSAGVSGAGNGTVSLSVAQNSSTSSRTGTVTIAGQTFTVQQAAAPCTYSLSSTLGSIGNGGGPLGTNVLTSANCSWTAQSNAAWITVSSGASGAGNGTVSLAVAQNTSTSSRTGTVTIAGQTFTVQQAAAPPVIVCSYSVSSTQFSFGPGSQTSSVQVSTAETCAWSASSSVPWITVAPAAPLAGSAAVTISAQANTSTASRTASVTVAGQAISVTQAGQPPLPTLTLSPGQLALSASQGSHASSLSSVEVGSSQPGIAFAMGGGLPAWLSVSASAASTPATLQISANPAGLAPGVYTANIPIQSTGTTNPNLTLGISFRVEGEVAIRPSPRSLSFSAVGADPGPLSQTLRVKVSGSGTPIRAFIQGASWLSASVEPGTNHWVVRVNADPRGLLPGVYDANIGLACTAASCESVSIPVRLHVTGLFRASDTASEGSSPRIGSGGIVNAASFQQGITEGSWMSIFGSGFATETREWSIADFDGLKFPTEIAGVSVKVNGIPAPIHFVSPGQVNFQAPAKIGAAWVLVEVQTPDGAARAYAYASKENPGFFQIDPVGQVAALLGDGRALGRLPDDPAKGVRWTTAKPGDTIAIYGTGFGPTDPAVQPGFIYSGAASLTARETVHVTIGGVEAKVEFAGQSGGGLNQINVVVPNLPRGDHEILATVDGVLTQFNGKLAVD